MTLNELKPRGYHLSDVEPDFQGMPLREWMAKKIAQQCAIAGQMKDWGLGQKWRQRAVATPRDSYGWKGI